MKISEAITGADALRHNTMTDEQKVDYLRRLDGDIADMMHLRRRRKLAGAELEQKPEREEAQEQPRRWPFDCTWPEDDATLLMPFPHDEVYVLYLVAMLDLYQQETALYANDMQVFNQAMDEARGWWIRNHRPKDGSYLKVW